MRWALRKLGVDECLIRTVMALYIEACTVVKTIVGHFGQRMFWPGTFGPSMFWPGIFLR